MNDEPLETLGTALPREIQRCHNLLASYKELGPVGMFGHVVISNGIALAHKAMMEGDIVEMMRAYNRLKECK